MKGTVQKSTRVSLGRMFAVALPLILMLGMSAAARADEADAKRLLKAMSDYLSAQQALSFDYDAALEVVTDEGQKLALASSGSVVLKRPDKIRATRSGGFVDVEMSFDGTTLTIFGKNANLYTQVETPGTVDHLVDELRNTYGRPLPAADLLLADPYDTLMADVTDVKDLGSGVVGGVECDYLAFRAEEVDWQIWIAHGENPYPCKYVINSKLISGEPQYSIQVSNWKAGDGVVTTDFGFKNTTDATKVELEDLEGAEEFPANFKIGGAQ